MVSPMCVVAVLGGRLSALAKWSSGLKLPEVMVCHVCMFVPDSAKPLVLQWGHAPLILSSVFPKDPLSHPTTVIGANCLLRHKGVCLNLLCLCPQESLASCSRLSAVPLTCAPPAFIPHSCEFRHWPASIRR